MKISANQREHIKQMFGGRCAYCGVELGERWHADHVEAVVRDWEIVRDENGQTITKNGITLTRSKGKSLYPQNDRIDNMFPSCIKCNILKSAANVEGFRSALTYMAESIPRIRTYSHVHHLQRFGKISIDREPVVFWFEQYKSERKES